MPRKTKGAIKPRSGHTAEDLRLAAARRVFSRLPTERQRELAGDIAETRANELLLAYPGLQSVSSGFRLKRLSAKGRPTVLDEPCVLLLADAKLTDAELQRQGLRRLPCELLCFVGTGRRKRLCAVPTDVDAISDHVQARAHAPRSSLDVRRTPAGQPLPGVATLALRRSEDDTDVYILSCRHVLSTLDAPPGTRGTGLDCLISVAGDPQPFARAIKKLSGALASGADSHDAQLAVVTDIAAARRALGDVSLTGLWPKDKLIPQNLFLLTSRGALPLTLRGLRPKPLPLDYRGDGSLIIEHELLIESQPTGERPIPGDSGSPLTTEATGGILVGMYVAGREGMAYAIPAWHLLDTSHYAGISPFGETWRLATDDELTAPLVAAVKVDRATFLARAAAAFGNVSASQREGFEVLLDFWNKSDMTDPRWLAYVLATCWHETGTRMQPIKETTQHAEDGFNRPTDEKVRERITKMFNDGKINEDYGMPVDGKCYFGRGFVQLTHKNNYAKIGKALGIGNQLVAAPDGMLDPEISAAAIFNGMRGGLFRRRKQGGAPYRLDDFFNIGTEDWIEARNIVNGVNNQGVLDKAEEIGDFARRFLQCLT